MSDNEVSKPPKKHVIKDLWLLFTTFFKIGLFTFGGGYAMIPLIFEEVVNKHKWLSKEEMNDIFLIAESTPGPISVNTATYVGYRVSKVKGSFFATLGLIVPSFTIILLIALFFKDFMSYKIVQAAFKGIKISVSLLILDAAYRLSKQIKFDLYAILMFIAIFITQLLLMIFKVTFSSIYFILIGALLGYVLYSLVPYLKRRKK